MLENDRVTLRAREARIAALEAQVEDYRQQLAAAVKRAVSRNQALVKLQMRPARPAATKLPLRGVTVRRNGKATPKQKRRSKRQSRHDRRAS